MANVENGGFINFLKRLFFQEGGKKAVQQAKQEKKPEVSKEEKKEKKDRVQEIVQELARVTPSHPAYEILGKIEIQPKTITDHPELGNLLLDIIHTINTDPNKFHDPRWLQDKIRRLTIFIDNLNSDPGSQQKVTAIEENVERLYIKSQKDRREKEVLDEIDRIQAGELRPEDTNPDMGSPSVPPSKQSWDIILESLPPEQRDAIKDAKDIKGTKATKDDRGVSDKDKKYVNYLGKIADLKRTALKEINPRNPTTFKNYQDLQRVEDKLVADFLEEHPQEGGRLYAATDPRSGGKEQVERQIQSDVDYRDYWFYHILENILYNHRMEPHTQLYQLYEMSDMSTFLDIVRRIKDEAGKPIGLKIADRYNVLKNTIFQSHDMDFYCAHPQQDMKEFIGSTALFLNEYIDAAVQDPMVSLAKRLYESQLLHIRDSHGGYIPREYLAWTEGKLRASKLDEDVERMLKQAIAAGQLYNTQIDKITELPAPSMWGRKQVDNKPYTLNDLYGGEISQSENWKRQLGELKIASALKQAKGLSLVDQRMLEVIAKSKGTGGRYILNNNNWNADAFNSVPYEGIVRFLEPVIHYYGRYGLGMDISSAFFNMIVSDRKNYNWDPNHMKVLMKHYFDGEFEEAEKYAKEHDLGDIQTRLYAMDNPFGYSGMWGTMTKWRMGDTTAGFDDWEKDQSYAAAVKLTNIGDVFSAPERESTFQKWEKTLSYEKAKRHFIETSENYEKYRTEYRKNLLQSEEIRFSDMAKRDEQKRTNIKDYDSEFEFYWRTQGEKRYQKELDKSWKDQLDEHKKPKKDSELLELTMKLERAYKARVWVQTTMKAPLIIARELEAKYTKHGLDYKGPLRKKIIWELLGIDVDELELLGAQVNLTPTAIQEAQFDRITDVEGALAAMQQAAIRNNKDLTENDFTETISHLEEPEQKRNFELARDYWHKVKKAMLGDETGDATRFYEGLGIKDAKFKDDNGKEIPRGLRFHDIDWEKIKKIDITGESRGKPDQFIVPELKTDLLTNKTIDRNYRHLFSTEDMGWEFLNINALGSRNPVRRAGDLGSHVQFGQLFENYLLDWVQRPVGNIDEMVKAQHEMWKALSGDFDYVASDALGRVAYSTGMIYRQADWAWKLPLGIGPIGSIFTATSISQHLHGRDRGIAWGPNEMLHYVQAVGSHILPKAKYSQYTGEEVMPQSEWTRALLGKRLGGTKANATYEIINMTLMIATLLTLYRAFTAKSEEEED